VCHGENGEGSALLSSPTLVKCAICDNPTVLKNYIDQSMPPGGANAAQACSGDCALNVTTFVLEAFNGKTDRTACEAGTEPSPSSFKRLSRLEYMNTLKDLLQLPEAPNVAAIPDDPSVYNFKTMASVQSVQVSHLNGYLSVATEQAEALMASPERRNRVLGCDYNNAGCFDSFITQFGALAYRRPLGQEEAGRIRQYVAGNASSTQDQFILALQIFLTSPNFIYRVEVGNSAEGLSTLDDYELVSRLAFALWGRGPSADLLNRAGAGELRTAEGLRMVAEQMLTDPRARENMQHFFEQWLATNLIEPPVEKPQGWYEGIIRDMQMETNKLLGEYVWENRDFMQIFTESRSYMTAGLAGYYGLPQPASADGVVTLPSGDPRANTGILTHASNMFSKGDGDLIAKRGNWLRSTFLCKELQLPASVVDLINGKFAGYTPMEILTERNRDAACERCHAQIDPIGVAFAPFDRSGRFDHSVVLADYPILPGFPDAANPDVRTIQDIARELSQMPEVSECLADRLFLYMRNHVPEDTDHCAVYSASDQFRNSSHQFASLLLAMVEDPAFRTRVAPEPDDSIEPPPAPVVNLALGKPVTTSTAQDGNPGSRLTDNDINSSSRWSAQLYPQWATIDLGAVRNIVQIEVYPYEDRAYRYTLDVSQDGSNYSRLVDRSTNSQGGNVIADLFAPTAARYVRINVTGASGYTGDWISFREIKILGPSQ
jgi:hypothetical protein